MEEGEASFEELECLEKLIDLSIRLESMSCPNLLDINWMNNLNRFLFHMGSTTNEIHTETEHDGRQVIFRGLDLTGKSVGWSIISASSMILDRCKGLEHLAEALTKRSMKNTVHSFTCLKALTIMNSSSRFRSGGYGARSDLLPNLEEVHICGLTMLVTISELGGHLGLRFSKLRVMEVTWCPKLKYLLSYGSFIRTLKNLEVVKIRCCNNLEELFIPSSRRTSAAVEPVFPKLRIMELDSLPKLVSLCREESLPQLEKLVVTDCSLLKKLPVTLQSASSLKEIKGEVQWWDQLEWGDDAIRLSLQHHFSS